jgi:hypothetical protein
MLKSTHNSRLLILKENPWPIRIAAILVSLIGGVVLIASFLSEDIFLWKRLTIICMGVGALVAGRIVWSTSSAKCVWVDINSKEIVIGAYNECNLWHWKVNFDQINLASVSQSLDEDGYVVYRPCLRLIGGGEVPLSSNWRLSKGWSMEIAEKINDLLNRKKDNEPNKAVEPTIMAVTDSAAQPPRQP